MAWPIFILEPRVLLSYALYDGNQKKKKLPLKLLRVSARRSWDSSRDERGVNALRWLALSSSRKCEDGEEDRLENRAIKTASTTNTPITIPATASPLTPDLPSLSFELFLA